MNKIKKLFIVKTLHATVWVFFNIVLFYLAYAVIKNKIDEWVWVGVAVILLEGVILLIFRNMCPLTLIAQNYSDSSKANFDIFLPEWLAKNNKLIYTIFFVFIICLLIYRLAAS